LRGFCRQPCNPGGASRHAWTHRGSGTHHGLTWPGRCSAARSRTPNRPGQAEASTAVRARRNMHRGARASSTRPRTKRRRPASAARSSAARWSIAPASASTRDARRSAATSATCRARACVDISVRVSRRARRRAGRGAAKAGAETSGPRAVEDDRERRASSQREARSMPATEQRPPCPTGEPNAGAHREVLAHGRRRQRRIGRARAGALARAARRLARPPAGAAARAARPPGRARVGRGVLRRPGGGARARRAARRLLLHNQQAQQEAAVRDERQHQPARVGQHHNLRRAAPGRRVSRVATLALRAGGHASAVNSLVHAGRGVGAQCQRVQLLEQVCDVPPSLDDPAGTAA